MLSHLESVYVLGSCWLREERTFLKICNQGVLTLCPVVVSVLLVLSSPLEERGAGMADELRLWNHGWFTGCGVW